MSLERRIGLGFTLGVDKTGGTSFATLGNIVDGWKGSGAAAEKVDITILVDFFKQFAKGQMDPGEFTFMIAADPNDNDTKIMGDMAIQTTPTPNWKITYPDVGTGTVERTFFAHVMKNPEEVTVGKLHTWEITIAVSGDPGFARS
jgi:hypothetical protein